MSENPFFVPEPVDPPQNIDGYTLPDPVSHSTVDVDAVLAAHAAGEHRVFHGCDVAMFNKIFGDHQHLRSHMVFDNNAQTLTLR